jgi:hypothetical protein
MRAASISPLARASYLCEAAVQRWSVSNADLPVLALIAGDATYCLNRKPSARLLTAHCPDEAGFPYASPDSTHQAHSFSRQFRRSQGLPWRAEIKGHIFSSLALLSDILSSLRAVVARLPTGVSADERLTGTVSPTGRPGKGACRTKDGLCS